MVWTDLMGVSFVWQLVSGAAGVGAYLLLWLP